MATLKLFYFSEAQEQPTSFQIDAVVKVVILISVQQIKLNF